MKLRQGTETRARLKRAAIYRDAALMIESGVNLRAPWEEFSCCAVAKAVGDDAYEAWNEGRSAGIQETRDYVAVYARDDGELQDFFISCDDARGARVLALCFMAAMVEAGDA